MCHHYVMNTITGHTESPSLLIPMPPSAQNNHDPELFSVVLFLCVVPRHSRVLFISFGCCFSLSLFLVLYLILEAQPRHSMTDLDSAECTRTLSEALPTLSYMPVAGLSAALFSRLSLQMRAFLLVYFYELVPLGAAMTRPFIH